MMTVRRATLCINLETNSNTNFDKFGHLASLRLGEIGSRKRRYTTSYSNVDQEDAERMVGTTFLDLVASSKDVSQLVAVVPAPSTIKRRAYDRLCDLIVSEGYPEGGLEPIKEVNIQDCVGDMLRAIIADFIRSENRKGLRLLREREWISSDQSVDGQEEFLVVDHISSHDKRYILVVEAKRDNFAKGMTQCLQKPSGTTLPRG
ncbi:hypothetical protein PsorP6_010542 [Peronosclerospora sorghi]|uniref:Uncharacterized protein n=1 Tax=Peronosclerospora sorghi TaxID=230839 RepID=A0ACC0VX30_9STRA|nr:hypothetical protein PsorP6_010542 [Peronosclerospora sorghi]